MPIVGGIDIGGTFTDVVTLDTNTGRLNQVKVPSTPDNLSSGLFRGLLEALKESQASPKDIKRLVHGTTVATNAILEAKGAKIGLLTTKGFEDVLIIGRQFRSDMYGLFYDPETPTFIMPRRRLRGVAERLDAEGTVITPLDEQDLVKQLEYLVEKEKVDAIAVCYLFSFINPAHERRTGELIRQMYPGVNVSLSSTVVSRFREYERTVITTLDAYVKPVISKYIGNLTTELRERDVKAPLQVMQSRGGITSAEICIEKPVVTVLSGPAAGLAGGMYVGKLCGLDNLITLDMGGTSCDVALVRHGQPYLSLDSKVGKYPLRQAMLEINTIGAGGGSIGFVDPAGGLKVGPGSAGAVPGPACYGLGGKDPTVTDASVVLGYLNPSNFAGGTVQLQPDLAWKAVQEKVAVPLGMEAPEAAAGIHRIVNSNMANQLRLMTVYKGFHPKDFSVVPLGGAGPGVVGRLIDQLGMQKALIPLAPGVLSAFGLLVADLEHEEVTAFRAATAAAAPKQIAEVIRGLERTCEEKWEAVGILKDGRQIQRYAEMRYIGQAYELAVSFPEENGDVTADTIFTLESRFHQLHQKLYQHSFPEKPIEFIAFRVVYTQAPAPRPEVKEMVSKGVPGGPVAKRQAYFDEYRDYVETPIYERSSLVPAQRFEGPAIIEQADTTTVVYPGQAVKVDRFGNLILTSIKSGR